MEAAHCVNSADNALGAIIVDIWTTPIVASYYDYVIAELKTYRVFISCMYIDL